MYRDQFKDISSTLGFRSPAALASHIHAQSDEDCHKLLLDYYHTKFGVRLSEYIKLPEQQGMDSRKKDDDREKNGRGREERNKPRAGAAKEKKNQGKKNVSAVHRGQRTTARGRRRAPSKGLRFESDASNDSEERYGEDVLESDSDDEEYGAVVPRKVKAGRGRRRVAVQSESGRGKNRRSRRGMVSHEVYQELFGDEEEDFETMFRKVIAKDHSGKAAPERSLDTATNHRQPNQTAGIEKRNDDANTTPSTTHTGAEKKGEKTSGSNPGVVSSESERSNLLKRDQSLSFLDDIFLTSSKAAKRKPPPKKAKRKPPPKKASAKRDKTITTTTDSESTAFGGGVTSDDTFDLMSKVKVGKEKYLESDNTAGTTLFTRTRVSRNIHVETFMDTASDDCNDAALWKRNTTFVPRQTLFDNSDESEDSESLFVANTNFKGVSRDIT